MTLGGFAPERNYEYIEPDRLYRTQIGLLRDYVPPEPIPPTPTTDSFKYYGVYHLTGEQISVDPTEAIIKALKNKEKKPASKNLSYTALDAEGEGAGIACDIYAYPKSLGTLSQYKLGTNDWLPLGDTYSRKEITIDDVDYYVYYLTTGCGAYRSSISLQYK